MTENWTRVGSLLPALFASLAGAGCAQVALDGSDGGAPAPSLVPHVAEVTPQPGAVPGDARFNVTFSAPMDEGQLLATSGRSETVVLVAASEVERMAAAIARTRLTAQERALLVPAATQVALDAQSLVLIPDAPLPAGSFYLLVASRLRDAEGKRLDGNGARFQYDVQAVAAQPRLLAPLAGMQAPANLARVRVQQPDLDAGVVGLIGEGGRQIAQGDGGEIDLCAIDSGSGSCSVLQAGQSYSLALDGAAVPDAGFTVADCRRAAPPALLGLELAPRDTSLNALVVLDWPALVRAKAVAAGCDAGCPSAEVLVQCAPPLCGKSDGQTDAGVLCRGLLELKGLAPATGYLLQLKAADDEGFVLIAPDRPFTTASELPPVIISEVMAYPPAPAPRSLGQYIEILNQGAAPVDVTTLSLLGLDGKVHPLLGDSPAQPVLLAPGARALAVGATFEKARYPTLPRDTLVLHAATHRLFSHGLREKDPPAFSLVQVQSGAPVVVANFPGGLSCPEGASLQRDEAAAGASQASWNCGAVGGSPGRAP